MKEEEEEEEEDEFVFLSCDDFFVDELLDLTNEDGFVKEEEEEKDKNFVFDHENSNTRTTTFSANKDEFGSVPTSELGRDEGGFRRGESRNKERVR